MTDSHFSHFDKIPLVIFDCTPIQRKPSIYPGAGSDRNRCKSNTNRPPAGRRSNGTRQKDGLRPSFIRFQVQKLPTAGRRLSPCLSLAPHALTACKVFQGYFLLSWQHPIFNFWVNSTHKTAAGSDPAGILCGGYCSQFISASSLRISFISARYTGLSLQDSRLSSRPINSSFLRSFSLMV